MTPSGSWRVYFSFHHRRWRGCSLLLVQAGVRVVGLALAVAEAAAGRSTNRSTRAPPPASAAPPPPAACNRVGQRRLRGKQH